MLYRYLRSLLTFFVVFSSNTALPNEEFIFADETPYAPQNEDFINNGGGFYFHFDYIRDTNVRGGKRRDVYNGSEDSKVQFSRLLNEEKKGPVYKRLSQPYPEYRWTYNQPTRQKKYTKIADLESKFKFKSFGEQTVISINVTTPDQLNSEGSIPLQAVAVDEENRVLKWEGSGWVIISEIEDHSGAADVVFVKVHRKRLSANEAAAAQINEEKKGYIIAASVLGGAALATGGLALVAMPAVAIGMGFSLAGSAIQGAVERKKFDTYLLETQWARFFKVLERCSFLKHATIAPSGQIWMIGSDHAPYWGGHKERYKHLTTKDPRTMFIPPEERIFDISAGEENLAVMTQDNSIFITEDAESLAPDTWVKHPTDTNSLVKKLTKTSKLPGGGEVTQVCCGQSPDIFWAVSSTGRVFQLSNSLNDDDQKTWQLVKTPLEVDVLRVSNGASNSDGSGRVLVLSKENEIFLLVDGQNHIWRKLEKLKPSNNIFVRDQHLTVRSAHITNDGAMAILPGLPKDGSKPFYASPEKLVDLGSPLMGMRNKDLVTVNIGKNRYFKINPSGELTIEKFETAKQAESTPECIFSLFRHGDIFGLKGKNGKWLTSAAGDSVISTVTATGDDPEMDSAAPGKTEFGTLAMSDMQFIAVKVPELRKPENIHIAVKARNNNGFLNLVGHFLSSVDPSTKEAFTRNEIDFWFNKVQDSSELPLYMEIAKSAPTDAVRLGFYMQLFKDFMDEELYEDEFFSNIEELAFEDSEDDERTISEVLASQWPKRIPSISDNQSAIKLVESLEDMIDTKSKSNDIWTETNASNIKKILVALEEVFADSEPVVKELQSLSKKISKINVFKAVDFKERLENLKTQFEELRKKFSAKKAEIFLVNAKNLTKSRVWGETLKSGDGSSTGLDLFSSWLIRQAAKANFILKKDETSNLAKELEDLAWSLIEPISVKERLDTLSKIIDQPYLLEDEAQEMRRQVEKVLEPEFIERLTPGDIKKLNKILKKAELMHKLDQSKASSLKKPTLLESVKRLRLAINEHSDENGHWQSSKDGTKKNPDGITVSYHAYTARAFFDDIKRLMLELNEHRKAEDLDQIPTKLRIPMVLILKQLSSSITKGSLGQEEDFSGLVKEINNQLEEL